MKIVSHARVGAPARGIVQLASDVRANLIVVGTHGRRGIARAVMGSVAENTVRHAHCPVLVVPPAGSAARSLLELPHSSAQGEDTEPGGRELWSE
jgi:K+-sensing histidine kinase KdpD